MNLIYIVLLGLFAGARASYFNQTLGYDIKVSQKTWSNFGVHGGCVTCPYTCVKPPDGPNGNSLNRSNTTAMDSVPDIYNHPKANGCCFAPKSKTTQSPSCVQEANPPEAEDCGFLSGPSLDYKISKSLLINPPTDPVHAILFASVDCKNFWAVGESLVKQNPADDTVQGSDIIDGGCYGNPNGEAMVLSGCLSTMLEFDKSKAYTWKNLAQKCHGLTGICTRTNSVWGRNLKCCTDRSSLGDSQWDVVGYDLYHKAPESTVKLSGLAITGIVLGGVALLMCFVHYGAKLHERAKQTQLMREHEVTDDYEEIVTPLTADQQPAPIRQVVGDPTIDVALEAGDQIFRQDSAELLYEGDLF